MTNSECEIMVAGCFNCSVHASFQNPVNTPVKVNFGNSNCSVHASFQNTVNNPVMINTGKWLP